MGLGDFFEDLASNPLTALNPFSGAIDTAVGSPLGTAVSEKFKGPDAPVAGVPNQITIPSRGGTDTDIVPLPNRSERQSVSTEAIRKLIPSLKQFESTTGREASSNIIEGISRGALTVASNRAAQDFALELQARGINADQAFRLAQQEIDVQVQNEQFRVQREGIAAGVGINAANARAQGASALGSGVGAVVGFVASGGNPAGAFAGSQAGGVLGGLFA